MNELIEQTATNQAKLDAVRASIGRYHRSKLKQCDVVIIDNKFTVILLYGDHATAEWFFRHQHRLRDTAVRCGFTGLGLRSSTGAIYW